MEFELIRLVRKSHLAPRMLEPADLVTLRRLAGDAAAADYALDLCTFAFINRIADLLGLDAEVLPQRWIRPIEPLRRLLVRALGREMAKLDLRNRPAERPKLDEALALRLAERESSSLGRAMLAGVHEAVEAALPCGAEEADGFHARPSNPVEDFAFVGTRYAHRTTRGMIAALRRKGFDDLGLLDLAIAVADASSWARLHRLLGFRPEAFYLSTKTPEGAAC